MLHKRIHIRGWIVDFLFAIDDYDIEEVYDFLYDMDAPKSVIRQTKSIIYHNEDNAGFTYSVPRIRRSLTYIGPVTSRAEFLDTIVHEAFHISVAIAKDLKINLQKEFPAYVSGDILRELADIIFSYGCPHCGNFED